MSQCDYPIEKVKDSKRKYTNYREIVLRQLSTADVHSKKRQFKAFLEECKFDLVRNVFLKEGADEVDFKNSWIIAWLDCSISMEIYTRMKPYQKINHFPSMNEICKKDLLAHNLKKMKKLFPKEYNFFPITFSLPEEDRSLEDYCKKYKKHIFIIKPVTNCQGLGIDIVKGIQDVKQYRNVVCQKYIKMPLLMDSFKLDLRLYVLVTSVSPLRIYIFNEGLVRLATVPYNKPNSSNLNEKRMHLTNYAVNRSSNEDCTENWGKRTCKKSFAELETYLDSMKIQHDHLWPTVDCLVVKTILSALPSLRHMFQTSFPMQTAMCPCFEILGFDVLLTHKIKPYLLEVNRSPSLIGSSAMDMHLKKCLIRNTLEMVLPTARQISLINKEQHRKAVRRLTNTSKVKDLTLKERILSEYQEKRESKKMGNFRRIYPAEDGRYDAILQSLFSPPPDHQKTGRDSLYTGYSTIANNADKVRF